MSWDDIDRLLSGSVGAARFEEDPTALPPEVTSVRKLGARLPLSTDQAMDEGLIPDTRPARPRKAPVQVTSWSLARDLARVRVRGA